MPRPRRVLNAFTPKEVHQITGISVHMIGYLAREGYLNPSYQKGKSRGFVRYYSYRDLVIARIIQKLRESGIELKRLKETIRLLNAEAAWFPRGKDSIHLIATDGKQLYYPQEDGSLLEITPGRQLTFAFVIDARKTQDEVREKIQQISKKKLRRFSLKNKNLIYEKTNKRRQAK